MKKQNFDNHRQYYIPHHFVFYPIVITLLIFSATYISKFPEQKLEWIFITSLFFLLAFLSFMVRQHYALNNQNRIVRLEMRLRYFQLTKQPFDAVESKLQFGQIAALRFAHDNELLPLIEKTLIENLSPTDIKKQIVNWLPDYMRA
jgi:hypothetical protein